MVLGAAAGFVDILYGRRVLGALVGHSASFAQVFTQEWNDETWRLLTRPATKYLDHAAWNKAKTPKMLIGLLWRVSSTVALGTVGECMVLAIMQYAFGLFIVLIEVIGVVSWIDVRMVLNVDGIRHPARIPFRGQDAARPRPSFDLETASHEPCRGRPQRRR
jgi:hypothetical protein